MSEVILHQCGRAVTTEEVEHACEVVRRFRRLSRDELASTLCEHWGWLTAAGGYRRQACQKLLERLEAQGLLELPAKRKPWALQRMEPVRRTQRGEPAPEVSVRLGELGPVRLEVVEEAGARQLWEEWVDRYHPLRFKRPFGCTLRYFITSPRGRLGCLLFAGAAKAVAPRDAWIGWTRNQRLSNLAGIVNNSRFLILPWVKVAHLASHVLGQVARHLRADWQDRWGYQPVLMETFVDPRAHKGTCYHAAGWQVLCLTSGTGLPRPGRTYSSRPKLILVRPLVCDFRARLCHGRWAAEVSR